MKEAEKHLENLAEVRKLMENSSRFLSLSGMSGIGTGLVALISASVAHFYFGVGFLEKGNRSLSTKEMWWELSLLALLTLAAALAAGAFFTIRKARKQNANPFGATSLKMLWALAIPLVTGGVFCLAMLYHGLGALVAPAMLVFYGLALINASKYTIHETKSLGLIEVCLGLVAAFFTGYGLLFWTLGFGAAHLLYGFIMHKKYGS